MPPAPPARTAGLTLVLGIAALGAVFLLGRAVVSQTAAAPSAHPTTVAEPASGEPADTPSRPAQTSRPVQPTTPSPATPSSEPDSAPENSSPPLPLEDGAGPFGARMSSGSDLVALTFDDGPDPRWTPQALSLLRQHGVKATFCLVGEQALAHPELVRAIAADGHTLCNHSWNHDFRLGTHSLKAIQSDMTRTNQAIRKAVPGARITYFRAPGGNWTSSVVTTALELGMTPLHWSVDPWDWNRPGTSNIVATVTGHTEPGSIVLLHDAGGNRQQTIAALGLFLPKLVSRFQVGALPLPRT